MRIELDADRLYWKGVADTVLKGIEQERAKLTAECEARRAKRSLFERLFFNNPYEVNDIKWRFDHAWNSATQVKTALQNEHIATIILNVDQYIAMKRWM